MENTRKQNILVSSTNGKQHLPFTAVDTYLKIHSVNRERHYCKHQPSEQMSIGCVAYCTSAAMARQVEYFQRH